MFEDSSKLYLSLTKGICMVLMFVIILITGNIPLKSVSFNSNPKMMSLSTAFSGGLFIAVGIIHLMPEAVHKITHHFQADGYSEVKPYAQIVCLLSFILFLYLEKIAFSELPERTSLASDISHHQKKLINPLLPYILQVAIGIHAFFEGLAIGIETHVPDCVGIALAVVCHKWAEGLTLGIAFKKANTDLIKAQKMIFIQALMNPLGIGTGWLLSSQGELITGLFTSISAGTFIYISTIEVIVEEFEIRKFQLEKFLMYLAGIIFICMIWFLENLLE